MLAAPTNALQAHRIFLQLHGQSFVDYALTAMLRQRITGVALEYACLASAAARPL